MDVLGSRKGDCWMSAEAEISREDVAGWSLLPLERADRKGETLETLPIHWLGSLGEILGKVSLMDSHSLVFHGLGYGFSQCS